MSPEELTEARARIHALQSAAEALVGALARSAEFRRLPPDHAPTRDALWAALVRQERQALANLEAVLAEVKAHLAAEHPGEGEGT